MRKCESIRALRAGASGGGNGLNCDLLVYMQAVDSSAIVRIAKHGSKRQKADVSVGLYFVMIEASGAGVQPDDRTSVALLPVMLNPGGA